MASDDSPVTMVEKTGTRVARAGLPVLSASSGRHDPSTGEFGARAARYRMRNRTEFLAAPADCDWLLPCLCRNGRHKRKSLKNWRTRDANHTYNTTDNADFHLYVRSGGVGRDAAAGRAVYARACKTCHGADGTANPALAKMMKVDIADLKSAAVQAMTNDQLKQVITDGKGKMRPITSVTGAALDDVAAYIHTLKK